MCHTIVSLRAIDYHTAGEPFRIVVDGFPAIMGATVAERRFSAQKSPDLDAIRRLLCREPRGHADMYGGFLVPPDDDGAHFGVLFWHNDGYSTACGHGTIALGAWAVSSGLVAAEPDAVTPVRIDVPSGRVVAHVRTVGGRVDSVVFENVASYRVARAVPVATSHGSITAGLAFGGALYASVDVAQLGLSVRPEHYSTLLELGREIKWALNDSPLAQHPTDDRLSGVYGSILFEDLGDGADGPHQRNMTVFADGRVDRSPCGSGTAARVAELAADGRLRAGQVLTHDSIVDSRFLGRVRSSTAAVPGGVGVIAEVEGMAYRTGDHVFHLDPADPVGEGFLLR
ncbi:proline racemase family protein [Mycetocola sp.]|uniref:proline racemase family protein n=1 Tax=Mycetocola sp. TaxID=1871042 RepID=UPI003989F4DD